MKKVLLGLLALFVVVVAGAGAFVASKPSLRPASAEKVEATPERAARGKYLAESLLSCTHCHTKPNPTRWGSLGDPDRHGAGGLCWNAEMDFPGTVCSPNLTPDPETGLGNWTDGEIIRAIREGVRRDGTPLFALMPYTEFAALPDEDVRSIVVYLRGLKPVQNAVPERDLKPPLNIIVRFMPKPLDGPVAPVSTADPIGYGKYLATVANCRSCHSPVDEKHKRLPGKEFSGGQQFKFMGLSVRSANLTPHETGLGAKTKENFIGQFRSFSAPEIWDLKVEPGKNTIMPWLTLSRLTDEDLGAIFAYLRSLAPIANGVEKYPHPVLPAAGVPIDARKSD